MIQTLRRPEAHESSEYFKTYIQQVEGDDILNILQMAESQTEQFLRNLSPDKWDYAYAPGKWTIKEVMIHLIDAERIFAYRSLRVARKDMTPLPGFEQDDYIPESRVQHRSPESIIQEYKSVRAATLSLFNNLDDEAMQHIGTTSNAPFSALALAFIIAGHEVHHLRILRERYL